MKAFKNILFFLVLSAAGYSGSALASEALKATFFFSPTCHACIKVKNEFMPEVEKKYKDKVIVEYKDVTQLENYRLLLSLKEHYRLHGEIRVPEIFLNGQFLIGEKEIISNLGSLIESTLGGHVFVHSGKQPILVDILSRFRTFTPLAIISAGLIDGINPCAFAVIIFFISFLTLHGYKKKEIALIGLCFVIAVFLAYFLIGLGLFNFLYHVRGFWWVAKTINLSIGILSIFLGVLALYDFFKYLKGGRAQDMTLQLPDSLKRKIQTIIGARYRRLPQGDPQPSRHAFIGLASSAFLSGFLVSLLEAVCTGQVYLPTITLVFKTTHLKVEALGYLLLYNAMFVAPLLLIFLVVLLGTTSQELTSVFKKNFLLIKILMAALFFSLGTYLLWRA